MVCLPNLKSKKLYKFEFSMKNDDIFFKLDDKEFNRKNYKTECRNKNDCYRPAPGDTYETYCKLTSLNNINYCNYKNLSLYLGNLWGNYFDGYIGNIFFSNNDSKCSFDFNQKIDKFVILIVKI